MKLIPIAAAALVASLSFGAAQASIILDLDATKSTGPFGQEIDAATKTITLDPGTYTYSVVDNTANGGFAGWQYADGSGYREAFTISNGGFTASIDVYSPANKFTSYATTADALSAFASAPLYSGYVPVGTAFDAISLGVTPSLSFTLFDPATLTFGIPDYMFGDNTGGVSLAITAAVPEPETYALMLAGLGAIGFVGRRRKTA